jgi:hypothetical protein
MSIGQMGDIRQSILNVKTPPGDGDVFYSAMQKEPASIRRENSDFQKSYRKYLDSIISTFFDFLVLFSN